MRCLSFVVSLLVCFAAALSAAAGTIHVTPTGTSADIHNVKAAIDSAQAGDVILLKAGTFDWSGNSGAIAPFVIPLGLPIGVSDITIAGELDANGNLLTSIIGPVDADGLPVIFPSRASNAAFVNGPTATGVTIRDLILRNFETAIGLLQTTNTAFAGIFVPGGDFSTGADNFTIENLLIENVFFGVEGAGANDGLIVRNTFVQVVRRDGVLFGDQGAFLSDTGAIANRSRVPRFPGAADGIVIENNILVGPGRDLQVFRAGDGSALPLLVSGISIEGRNIRIENNQASSFSIGIGLIPGGQLHVVRNSVTDCQVGLGIFDLAGDPRVPEFGLLDGLVRNNRFTNNRSGVPSIGGAGAGISTNSDNTRFVGNNVENNEFAGIALLGNESTPPERTPTRNLIIGNKNVVVGSPFALMNNTISGSQTSAQNVGEAIQELLFMPPFD